MHVLSGARLATLASFVFALAAPARSNAHDPFEITTDAHIDVYGLNVHTTLSLDSAARICIPSVHAARFVVGEFSEFRARFEHCAREFYTVTSGGERLTLRSLSLQLSPEDDLEMRVVYDRPKKSPLVFDSASLDGLPPAAGIVLTATGQRSFLGQKLLRPTDAHFELTITAEAEALGTPSTRASPEASVESSPPISAKDPSRNVACRLAPMLLLAPLAVLGVWLALRRRRSHSGRATVSRP